MKTVVVLGAGKIGRMVCHMLGKTREFRLRVADRHEDAALFVRERLADVEASSVDFQDSAAVLRLLEGADAVISCAPFHCNPAIAECAKRARVHYLDPTEDVEVTARIAELAGDAETAFIPQCGLAPGFITIVAMHLLQRMSEVHSLELRVGALPRYPTNRLKYNLTWSTEGLINQYCNPCEVLLDGELREVQPLENLEELTIDGVRYEAFNTSGGLGTLARTLQGRVRNVNYKSLRYPGHNYLMKFLLEDLRMKDRKDTLREIFEECLPTTFEDQIVILANATGMFLGKLTSNVYARTILHREIDGENWSAIQITTASGICAVLDLLFEGKLPQRGFVRQEHVPFDEFIGNRFGRNYA